MTKHGTRTEAVLNDRFPGGKLPEEILGEHE